MSMGRAIMMPMISAPNLPALQRHRLVLAALRSGAAQGLREQTGLSQADVACRLGVQISTVSRWERGQRKPRGDKGRAYIEFVADLLLGSGVG